MMWFDLGQTLATRAVLGTFEATVNRLLHLDPDTRERLSALSGRVIAIEVLPFGFKLYVVPGTAGIVLSASEREPDTLLRGTPLALLRLMTGTSSQALFSGDVQIVGDTELAQRFRTILNSVEVDWEEELSKLFGDVAAHQIGRGIRGTLAWSEQAREALTLTLSEYLQEEARLCPRQEDTEEFVAQVDAVRMDTDRLEQRIRRLEAFTAGPADSA
jgi:ubiquinone biosynthesis protein UbiJ